MEAFCIDQDPGTWDRVLGYPQVRAMASIILRSHLSKGSISCPEGTQRAPSADHIPHRTVSAIRRPQAEPVDTRALIPPFSPPLRGRLAMVHSRGMELAKDMVHLLGVIGFRSMDLFEVEAVPIGCLCGNNGSTTVVPDRPSW